MNAQHELDEELGEVICDQCDGKGIKGSPHNPNVASICQKCQGRGKLDWCHKVVGVPEPKVSYGSTSGMGDSSGIYIVTPVQNINNMNKSKSSGICGITTEKETSIKKKSIFWQPLKKAWNIIKMPVT